MHDDERVVGDLNGYWDRVVSKTATPLDSHSGFDPTLAATIRRLHALDDVPAAHPAYARRLLEDLMSSMNAPRLAQTNNSHPRTNVSPREERGATWRRGSSRRWWPATELAAMAAALFLLLGPFFWDGWRVSRLPSFLTSDSGPSASPVGQVAGNPWIGGSSGGPITIPASANEGAAITLHLLTFAPGSLWSSPEGTFLNVMVESGIIDMQIPAGGGSWERAGRGTSYGVQGSIHVRNTTDKQASVTLLAIGSRITWTGSTGSVQVQELGGGDLELAPGTDVEESIMRYRLGPGEGESFDTGRDGVGLIAVEGPATDLSLLAGEGAIRRTSANGLTTVEAAESISGSAPGAFLLGPGDSVLMQRGAAFSVANRGDDTITVLIVTLEPNSALVQQGEQRQATAGAAPIEATPLDTAANVEGTPIGQNLPLPEECDIEPRTLDSFQQVLALQTSGSTPVATSPFRPGHGEPADAETVESVTATMRLLAACFNSGDGSRIFALYSDDFLILVLDAESVAAIEADEPLAGWLNTPMPPVWDVRVQPDGRVTAKVQVNHERALLTFVSQDNRWLIDFFDDQTPIEPPPAE